MKLVVSQTTIVDDAHENMTAIALSICQKHWNKYMTECTMGQKEIRFQAKASFALTL